MGEGGKGDAVRERELRRNLAADWGYAINAIPSGRAAGRICQHTITDQIEGRKWPCAILPNNFHS